MDIRTDDGLQLYGGHYVLSDAATRRRSSVHYFWYAANGGRHRTMRNERIFRMAAGTSSINRQIDFVQDTRSLSAVHIDVSEI